MLNQQTSHAIPPFMIGYQTILIKDVTPIEQIDFVYDSEKQVSVWSYLMDGRSGRNTRKDYNDDFIQTDDIINPSEQIIIPVPAGPSLG